MRAVPAPRVILHLGAHRTGSTWVQESLTRHQDRGGFNDLTVFGPRALRPRFLWLVRMQAALPVPASALLVRIAAPGLAQALAAGGGLLISEENLLGRPDKCLTGTGALYPDARRMLRAAAALLGTATVRPVLVVRSYDEWYPSAHWMVSLRRTLPPVEALAPRWASAKRGWPAVVADIIDVFGGCDVIRYEDVAADLGKAAEALVGPHDLPNIQARLGRSFSKEAMAAVTKGSGTRLSARDILALHERERGRPAQSPLSDDHRAALCARYQADLAILANMGVRMAPPYPVWPKDPAR